MIGQSEIDNARFSDITGSAYLYAVQWEDEEVY